MIKEEKRTAINKFFRLMTVLERSWLVLTTFLIILVISEKYPIKIMTKLFFQVFY